MVDIARSRRFRWRTLAALAAGALGVVSLSATSSAITLDLPVVTGVVACDSASGYQVVTWTMTNPTGSSVTITGTSVTGPGTGTAIDTSATMTPNPLPVDETASGTTRVSGDATGDFHLQVTFTYNQLDPTVDGEVVLEGGCEAQVVPTSEVAPSTVAPSSTVEQTTTTAAARPSPPSPPRRPSPAEGVLAGPADLPVVAAGRPTG